MSFHLHDSHRITGSLPMTSPLATRFDDFTAMHPGMWTVQQWKLHDVIIEARIDNPTIGRLFELMLQTFPQIDAPASTPDVRIAISTAAHWSVPSSAEVLPPSSNEIVDTLAAYNLKTTFAREESLNYYEIAPLGGAVYDIQHGLAVCYVRNIQDYTEWQITHHFLLIVLLEMLRGQNLFWVHAGSVAATDQGVLLIGQTGSGKTTTVINLVEAGFQFLAEDRTLIRVRPEGVEILGLPLDVAVTPHTLEMFPSLRIRAGAAPQGRGKVRLNPAEIFPEALIPRAVPQLLLFPRITGGEDTQAQSIDAAAALRRVLPNSLLASHPAVTRAHFDALTQLISACRCFELLLGTDLARIPQRISDLLRYE